MEALDQLRELIALCHEDQESREELKAFMHQWIEGCYWTDLAKVGLLVLEIEIEREHNL